MDFQDLRSSPASSSREGLMHLTTRAPRLRGKADGAIALVFMIAPEGRMYAGLRFR
jgi:hypothetical protein